jgi:hypothetical protein
MATSELDYFFFKRVDSSSDEWRCKAARARNQSRDQFCLRVSHTTSHVTNSFIIKGSQ